MHPAPARLQPGATFAARFKIVKPMYEGFVGALYAAEQTESGSGARLLRVFPSPLAKSPAAARERFAREAAAPTGFEGAHVPAVAAAGVDEPTGSAWIAMGPLSGETLAGAVERNGSIQSTDLVEIVAQLRAALAPAHAAGRAHGEVTPENLFLAVGGGDGPFTLKLLAFGTLQLARECARADGEAPRAPTAGESLWMSPEQYAGERVGPASDVWTLGLLAFYLLTGMHYWRAGDLGRTSLESLGIDPTSEPVDPATARADKRGLALLLPNDFDDWFAKCVARDPADRFPEANEALAALTEILSTRVSLAFRLPRGPAKPPSAWNRGPVPGFEPEEPESAKPDEGARASVMPEEIRASQLPAQPTSESTPPPTVSVVPPPPGARAWSYALGGGALLAATFVGGVLVGQRFHTRNAGRTATNCPDPEGTGANSAEATPPPVAAPAVANANANAQQDGGGADPGADPDGGSDLAALPVNPALVAARPVSVRSGGGGQIYDDHTTSARAEVTQSCTLASLSVAARGYHTCVSDLIVRLRGPNGQTVVLQNHAGRTPFRSYSVARFNGTDARGTWIMSIEDDVGADSGNFGGFTMTMSCR